MTEPNLPKEANRLLDQSPWRPLALTAKAFFQKRAGMRAGGLELNQ